MKPAASAVQEHKVEKFRLAAAVHDLDYAYMRESVPKNYVCVLVLALLSGRGANYQASANSHMSSLHT